MTVELPIVRVSVHPDGAIVHRRGTAPVQSGRIVVGGLPVLLDPGSLRAGVEGARLLAARAGLDLPLEDRGEAVPQEEALLALRVRLERVRVEHAHLEAVRSWLGAIEPGYDPEGSALTAAALLRWADLDAGLTDWRAELDERLAELTERRVALELEEAHLEAVLASSSTEARWRRWSPSRRVELQVDGDDGAVVEATVSYAIPGARWSPAYSIDFDRDLARGRLAVRALVGQATGEDWSEVALTLSTAPCARRVELPALRLGTRSPERAGGWRPLPDDLEGLFPESPARPSVSLQLHDSDEDDLALEEPVLEASKPAPDRARVGAPPPPAPVMAAPGALRSSLPPSPQTLVRKRKERRSDDAGGGAVRPAKAPSRTGVRDEQLDYGSLRLAGPDAPRGSRGRLQAEDTSDRLAELDDAARSSWRRVLVVREQEVRELKGRRFPPHHVLPGPIEGHDVVHVAPGSASIPSDGRFHAIAVSTEELTARIRFHAVPRYEAAVFREVVASLPRAGALLPGPLEATIEGDLVLTTRFAGAAGDQEIRFGLGREEGLTVARNVRYHEESAGLLGGSRRFTTTLEVQLASALEREVEVELFERVPVSTGSDLSFELVEQHPPAERWEGQTDGRTLKGGRRQRVRVPAGAQTTAVLGYAFTVSNREELSGGDRRG